MLAIRHEAPREPPRRDPDNATKVSVQLAFVVETHRVPIFEKLGWFLNLKKREHGKPLPNWLVNALSLNRVKD